MRFVFVLAIFFNIANAYCYYIPCSPSVNMNVAVVTQNYDLIFQDINTNLSNVDATYKEYNSLLTKYNSKLSTVMKLKKEYLLLLSEKAELKENLLNIKDEK
jgi:hypothetical protein